MQNDNPPPCRTATRQIIPLLLLAVLMAACSRPQPPELQQATPLPSPKPVGDFQLVDHNGRAFTLANLKQHWTFVFFGYTHCPDVCPTSLTMLAQVQRKLEKEAALDELPRMVFVSVDPERDTPEHLAKFVAYFHPGFIGVTGETQELQLLTRSLGIMYGKVQTDSPDYLIDHSASILLFDPDGKFHALFSLPHKPGLISEDFLAIKHYYESIH